MRVRTEMLVQHEEVILIHRVGGNIEQASTIAELGLQIFGYPVPGKRCLLARFAQETDVAQLIRVTYDDCPFSAQKRHRCCAHFERLLH